MEKDIEICPICEATSVSVINGKMVRHERGLGYVPYRLYWKLAKGNREEMKRQARVNLCSCSGKKWDYIKKNFVGVNNEH